MTKLRRSFFEIDRCGREPSSDLGETGRGTVLLKRRGRGTSRTSSAVEINRAKVLAQAQAAVGRVVYECRLTQLDRRLSRG